jgi:hypothetical protein
MRDGFLDQSGGSCDTAKWKINESHGYRSAEPGDGWDI